MATTKKRKANGRDSGTATAAELLTERTRIEFDGRTYNLVMTNGALIEFEQITGLSSLMDGEKIYDKPSLGTICAMFYVLIKRDGAKLSHEDVIERMTRERVSRVYSAILAARMIAFQREKKDPPQPTTTLVS